MNKGLFITFEGNDGSGKTTISKLAYERLKEMGYPVIYTREPGGIDIAEQIRKVILDPANTAMDERCEALLYAASRRQHLVEKVLPALNEGSIVLCDIIVGSTLSSCSTIRIAIISLPGSSRNFKSEFNASGVAFSA